MSPIPFLHARIRISRKTVPLPAVAWILFTALTIAGLFLYVDLKPRVEENFFFSSEDPEFKADKAIGQIFPQLPFVIFAAKGDLRAPEYRERLDQMTRAIAAIPEVVSVQSLTRGPDNLKDAAKSPLWRRILLTQDGEASLMPVFLKAIPLEVMVPKLEKVRDQFHGPGFDVSISGAPYITEVIQRKLLVDFKLFSAAAFAVFGLMILFLFRSLRILAGVIVTCTNASIITLMINHSLRMKIGLLTANLSTMVFVITLSTLVFFTFNWKLLYEHSSENSFRLRLQTIRLTFHASFWSIFTTFLGFLSLLFVQAEPMRQLGIAGSIGTVVALVIGYLVYPWFLTRDDDVPHADRSATQDKPSSRESDVKTNEVNPLLKETYTNALLQRKFGWAVLVIACAAAAASLGLKKLSTDPSLLSYFQAGSELRSGLEYIDRNGGSSLLNIVVKDPYGRKFNKRKTQKRLMQLHHYLERGPAVGSVVSIPVILAEANRHSIARFLPREWLLKILENPRYGGVVEFFITKDRRRALFILRMKEAAGGFPRDENVKRLEEIVKAHDLVPELVGGIYVLQGRLAQLLASSLVSGIILLIIIFSGIGLFLTRSLQSTLALTLSLAFIPVCLLGLLGHFGIVLDMISSPAANIAIGMGVDSMVHMIIRVRILLGEGVEHDAAWARARLQLWKPVVGNMLIVGAGFGIFALSNFPPTQRFGFSVLIGSMLSPLAALLLLPWFACLRLPENLMFQTAHSEETSE